MLFAATKEHVKQCGLQPDAIGKKIGNGAGHTVHEYGTNSVIKIPRLRWAKHRLSIITAEDVQQNVYHVREQFNDYVLPTHVYPHRRSSSYCIVQDRVEPFVNVTVFHLREHVGLARQFADILRRNQHLIRTQGVSLDFFGKEGTLKTVLAFFRLAKPQMANIVVVEQPTPRLYIVDSQLFEIRKPENARIARRLMAGASRWGYELNRVFSKNAFGRDLAEREERKERMRGNKGNKRNPGNRGYSVEWSGSRDEFKN